MKHLSEGKHYIAALKDEDKEELAQLAIYIQDCNHNQGPFTRFNEPVVLTTVNEVQRYWDYDHLKYKNKRDPSMKEVEISLQEFNYNCYKEMDATL